MSVGSGRVIAGRYRLGRMLGRGGMGAVWQAEDTLLGRDVALKEVSGAAQPSEHQVRRTLREAQAAARLRHPSIVTVYDVVTDDGSRWIVMELVEGRSLAEAIAEHGLLTERRTAEIGLQVLDALRAAHREGIAHRDVKPANILLEEERVVLTDFGIAAIDDATALTATGQMVGSPAYLAPERINGQPATAAADMWSLGVTLYAAVTGRSPFQREDTQATLAAILHHRPESPAHAGRLWPVIKGLLDKDPIRRLGAEQARELLANVVRTADAGDPGTRRRPRWWPVRQARPEDTPDGLPGTLVAPSPTLAAPTAHHQEPGAPAVAGAPDPDPLTVAAAPPAATGSTVTGSTVTGSTVTGSTVTGSTVTGSTVTGSTVTGPAATGPTATASTVIAPTAAGSTAAGPTALAGPTPLAGPASAAGAAFVDPGNAVGSDSATLAAAESPGASEAVTVAAAGSGVPDAEAVTVAPKPAAVATVDLGGVVDDTTGPVVAEEATSRESAATGRRATPLPAHPGVSGARRSSRARVWPVAVVVAGLLLAGGSARLFWPDSGPSGEAPGAAAGAGAGSAAPSVPASASAVARAVKPVDPNLDACLVGTWRSTSTQVVNHFEGVDKMFTSKGGLILRIREDGDTIEDYNRSAPLTATINGNKYVETLRGVRKSKVQSRNGKIYGSGFSGGPTLKMTRNGKYQSIEVTNPTTSYALTYICSDTALTIYGDENTSTDSYERVSRTP
ncbi:protein kinase domain-containing protein [Actinoplanes sp. CA-252034]|uniref:serine/threonine-protein kinase n=1 Tax=Actinoplanes sp. CA-252034 TaxID=3239906 RepID=UPI003D958A21